MMITVENKTARKLMSIIEEFRKLDQEMQAQTMMIFLAVMGKPGITMRGLEELTGLASSSVSRNVATLSEWAKKDKPGHNLLSAYEDPDDRRYKRVKPTANGVRVYNSLIQILGG